MFQYFNIKLSCFYRLIKMDESGKDVVLSVQGLSKSYDDLVAVNDLSFSVFKGEIFGFLGPNGAGKTTTISMICGLLKRDSGTITINGSLIDDDYRSLGSKIGLCPQDLIIWESLTCLEQLEIMGSLYDLKPGYSRKRAKELLEIFGLTDKSNKLAKTLSGGMKRRLNIALGLVHEPEILILDEPQAGLDPQSRILVREYIRSLSEKMTIILTTHEMDEADRLSDRVAIIDYGKLLVMDTPGKLKDQVGEGDILEIQIADVQEEKISLLKQELPGSLKQLVFEQDTFRIVAKDIPGILPLIMEKFKKNLLKIEDIKIRKKTLEDVFIGLTGRRLRE